MEEDLKVGQKMAWMRMPRVLRIQPKSDKQDSSRMPPAVPGPGRQPARQPSRPPTPGAVQTAPPAPTWALTRAAPPLLLPPRPREPGAGLPRHLPASEEPSGRRARSLLPPHQTARGAPAGGEVRLGGTLRARHRPGADRGRGDGPAPPRRLPSPSRLPGSAPGGNDVLLPG